MNADNTIYSDLHIIKELLYDKCEYILSNLVVNPESKEYSACSFELNNLKIIYRASKITPTKTGQFVTIWKRNENGITEPIDYADNFDFMVITCIKDKQVGQFIFPKQVLSENGIISKNAKQGKRGIRVYPPWDVVQNKQAANTQQWQQKYFVELGINEEREVNFAKELLST